MNSLRIINCRLVSPLGSSPLRGEEMGRLRVVDNAVIDVVDGKIQYAGASEDFNPAHSSLPEDAKIIDAGGRAVRTAAVLSRLFKLRQRRKRV